jgi:hypothetical protein
MSATHIGMFRFGHRKRQSKGLQRIPWFILPKIRTDIHTDTIILVEQHPKTSVETLPISIWIHIFKFACVDGGRTGCSLAAVSRYFRRISRTIRMQSIALQSTHEVFQFHEAFLRRQEPDAKINNLLISIGSDDIMSYEFLMALDYVEYIPDRFPYISTMQGRRLSHLIATRTPSPSSLWKRGIKSLKTFIGGICPKPWPIEPIEPFLRQAIEDIISYFASDLVSLTISLPRSGFAVRLEACIFPELRFLSVDGCILVHSKPETFPALTHLDFRTPAYLDPWPKYIANTKSIRYLRLFSPEHVRALSVSSVDQTHEEASMLLMSRLEKCPNIQRILFVVAPSGARLWTYPDHPMRRLHNPLDELESYFTVQAGTWQDKFKLFARQDRVVFCTAPYDLSQMKDDHRQPNIYTEWLECNEDGCPSWVNWWGVSWDIETLSNKVLRQGFSNDWLSD